MFVLFKLANWFMTSQRPYDCFSIPWTSDDMFCIDKIDWRYCGVVSKFERWVALSVETENISVSASQYCKNWRLRVAFVYFYGDYICFEDVWRGEKSAVARFVAIHVEHLIAASSDEQTFVVVHASGISFVRLNHPA